MPHLREETIVRWPDERVPTYLEWYLDQLSPSDKNHTTLELKVAGDVLGLPGGITVGREVLAAFAPIGDELERRHQQLEIHWRPKGGGPFPTFKGTLAMTQLDLGRCLLVLDGEYEPPFGAAGEAFDIAFGRKIAHATARELLHSIKRTMEASPP